MSLPRARTPALHRFRSGEDTGDHTPGDSVARPANPDARMFKGTETILLLRRECRGEILEINQLRSGWNDERKIIRPCGTMENDRRIPVSLQDTISFDDPPDTLCLADFPLSLPGRNHPGAQMFKGTRTILLLRGEKVGIREKVCQNWRAACLFRARVAAAFNPAKRHFRCRAAARCLRLRAAFLPASFMRLAQRTTFGRSRI